MDIRPLAWPGQQEKPHKGLAAGPGHTEAQHPFAVLGAPQPVTSNLLPHVLCVVGVAPVPQLCFRVASIIHGLWGACNL